MMIANNFDFNINISTNCLWPNMLHPYLSEITPAFRNEIQLIHEAAPIILKGVRIITAPALAKFRSSGRTWPPRLFYRWCYRFLVASGPDQNNLW